MPSLFKSISTLTLASLPLFATANDDSPTIQISYLKPVLAQTMVDTAFKECTKRGYKVAVAMVNRDGNLAAFLRNPLAGAHTVTVSQQKAYAAATFQTATSQMGEEENIKFAPGILLIQGGVPIEIAGNFYGAIAVSGADSKDDEECAQAGIDGVAEELEFAN